MVVTVSHQERGFNESSKRAQDIDPDGNIRFASTTSGDSTELKHPKLTKLKVIVIVNACDINSLMEQMLDNDCWTNQWWNTPMITTHSFIIKAGIMNAQPLNDIHEWSRRHPSLIFMTRKLISKWYKVYSLSQMLPIIQSYCRYWQLMRIRENLILIQHLLNPNPAM